MDIPRTYPVPVAPMTPTPAIPLNEEQQIDARLTEIEFPQEDIWQRAVRTGKKVVEWHGYKPFLR